MKLIQTGSTAAKDDLEFLMVDSTDHVTGKTGLTVTVTIRTPGGSFASPSGTVSEIANGWYRVAANATDNGTVGGLLLHATATGADPTDGEFQVIGYDPTAAQVPANVTQWAGTATTLTGGLPDVNTKTIANGIIAASTFAANALDAVWSTTTRLLTAGTNIVLAKGTGVTGFNDLDAAGVRSAVGLASANLDMQLSVIDDDVLSRATPSDVPSAATIAQAVWDALTSALTTAGSIGKMLVTNVDALISSRLAAADYTAPDNADIAAIKTRTDLIPDQPAAVSDVPTAIQNADALLTRDMSAVTEPVGVRYPLEALRFIRNKWSIVSGILTVFKEDDATSSWTSTVTTDAAAEPVITSDPA